MIMLTYRKAMEIQAEQLKWYGMKLRYRGKVWLYEVIKSMTKPCDHPDTPMKATTINELVPRGCDIESKYLLAMKKFGTSNTKSFTYGDGWYW